MIAIPDQPLAESAGSKWITWLAVPFAIQRALYIQGVVAGVRQHLHARLDGQHAVGAYHGSQDQVRQAHVFPGVSAVQGGIVDNHQVTAVGQRWRRCRWQSGWKAPG